MNTSIQNNLDNINPESKIIKTENSLDNSKVPSEKEEIKENKENKKEENELSNITKTIPILDSSQNLKNEEYNDKVNNLDFDKQYTKEKGTLSKICGLKFDDSSPISKIKDNETTPSGIEEYKFTLMKMLDDSGRNYQLKSQYNNNNKSNNNKNKYNFSFYVQNNSLLNYYDNNFLNNSINDNKKLIKQNEFFTNNYSQNYSLQQNNEINLLKNYNNKQLILNNNNLLKNENINHIQNYYPNQNNQKENENVNSNAYNYYIQNLSQEIKSEKSNLINYYLDNGKINEQNYNENPIYNNQNNLPQFLIQNNPIVNVNVNTSIPSQTINYYPQINKNQNFINMFMLNQQNNPQIIFSLNENNNYQNKNKKSVSNLKINYSSLSINELIKNSVEICKEQSGCRLIQKKIEEQPEIASKILNNLFQNLLEIVNNSFGNYLIQQLFDYMNKEQFLQFIALIKIDLYQICINSYGTRVIQKLIDYLNLEILLKTFMNIIKPTIKGIIIDINGSHIILKLMNLKNKFVNSVILNEICDNIFNISMHKHGCCVLQKCIEKMDVNERKPVIDNILNYCRELISDKCGNYIIQFIISFNDEKIMEVINNILITDIENFSKQKFSSNVVEKILEKAPNKICKELINSLINENIILSILFDKFGNYVLQKSLQRADKNTQKYMLQVIAPHLYKLKYYSFGLKLYSRLIITYSYLGQIILDKGNSGNNNNINFQNNDFNIQDNNNIIDMNLIQNSNNDFYNVSNNNIIYNNNYYNNNAFQNIGINNNLGNDFILNNMYNQNK